MSCVHGFDRAWIVTRARYAFLTFSPPPIPGPLTNQGEICILRAKLSPSPRSDRHAFGNLPTMTLSRITLYSNRASMKKSKTQIFQFLTLLRKLVSLATKIRAFYFRWRSSVSLSFSLLASAFSLRSSPSLADCNNRSDPRRFDKSSMISDVPRNGDVNQLISTLLRKSSRVIIGRVFF